MLLAQISGAQNERLFMRHHVCIFRKVIATRLARIYPQVRVTWGNMNAGNGRSIRAVTKYGHTGYRVGKRILYTGAACWKYLEDHMV